MFKNAFDLELELAAGFLAAVAPQPAAKSRPAVSAAAVSSGTVRMARRPPSGVVRVWVNVAQASEEIVKRGRRDCPGSPWPCHWL